MSAAREPGLQQRRIGGDGEERQPDRGRQQAQQPERRTVARRVAEALRNADRQRREGEREQRDMRHHDMAGAEPAGERMRIGVAQQQDRLEEHHGDRPHRRRAAELRQHHLGEHRLHGEQQRGGEEQRRRKDRQHQPRTHRDPGEASRADPGSKSGHAEAPGCFGGQLCGTELKIGLIADRAGGSRAGHGRKKRIAVAQRRPMVVWSCTDSNSHLLGCPVRGAAGGNAAAVLRFARRELLAPLEMQAVSAFECVMGDNPTTWGNPVIRA